MLVDIPCRIGDEVWGIRSYKGVAHPQRGFVNEIFFTNTMRLTISVKHICLGEWGEKIFATQAEAEEKARLMNEKQRSTYQWQ